MKTVALITGASSGIGQQLAQIHAERGGDLVIVARSQDQLLALKSQLESQYGIQVMVIAKDLTLPNAAQEVYDAVRSAGISVDYLMNNAGFGGIGKFHERDWSQDLAMIQLNIIALTALSRLFIPDFLAQNKGRILNISSVASLLPGPLQAVYYATKAYVTSLSNAIAEELRGSNVTVTTLLPGATDTKFSQVSGMDQTNLFKETVSARFVAQAGYEAMLAGKLNLMVGTTLSQRILLSLIPFAPRWFVLRQIHAMQEVVK